MLLCTDNMTCVRCTYINILYIITKLMTMNIKNKKLNNNDNNIIISVLPSLVVAIRLSGSTCEKQYDELSDDTNDMDVVEVDLSPGLLAGSTTPPYLPAPLSGGDVGAGTISMTTIRKTTYRQYYRRYDDVMMGCICIGLDQRRFTGNNPRCHNGRKSTSRGRYAHNERLLYYCIIYVI